MRPLSASTLFATAAALAVLLAAACEPVDFTYAADAGSLDSAGDSASAEAAASSSSSGASAPDATSDSASAEAAASSSSSSSSGASSPDAGEPDSAPRSDVCPQNADYSYEFSYLGADAPLCGPYHGGPCADPAALCCYFDTATRTYTCLPWLDGG